MVLGSCVILTASGRTPMTPESISITGEQDGFIVTFSVAQHFRHTETSPTEVSYIIPTNCKMCVYDTTFTVGSEVIKPVLENKQSAQEIYSEAVSEHRTALLGRNLGNGLTEFTLGNVPPNVPCSVTVRVGFTCANSGAFTQTFKFPLDVCTPSGSLNCITSLLQGPFSFSVTHARAAEVEAISSNAGGRYDCARGVFAITEKPSVASIIVTTKLKSALASSAIISGQSAAITVLPANFGDDSASKEFVFVVDCSGSMSGARMSRARECLQLFIRSLPPGSFFNIVRFGSRFERLFETPAAYDDGNVRSAMLLAANMQANLGGTELLAPLSDVFGQRPSRGGQRQVFVLTDGEVDDADAVLDLARRRARENRCFAFGIGADADAGVVEGLARETGGRASFVQGSDEIADMLIPQLECALLPALGDVSVDVSGVEGVEFAPFPIPGLSRGVATTVFARAPSDLVGVAAVLVSGECQGASVDLAIPTRQGVLPEDRIAALFAFAAIEALERELRAGKGGREQEVKATLVRLSTTHGILCSQTAFVGVSQQVYRPEPDFDDDEDLCCDDMDKCDCCFAAESAPYDMVMYHCCDAESASDDELLDVFPSDAPPPPGCAASPPPPPGSAASPPPPPSSAAPPARPPSAPPAQDLLMKIVGLQNLDGSWSNVDAVVSLSGKSLDDFTQLRVEVGAVFVTVLGVALLRHFCSGRQSAWSLVEKKALGWLARELGDAASAEEIITRAIAIL